MRTFSTERKPPIYSILEKGRNTFDMGIQFTKPMIEEISKESRLMKEWSKNVQDIIGSFNLSKDRDVNMTNIILASIMIVEKLAIPILKIKSVDKFKTVQRIIPIVIDMSIKQGHISKEEGTELKEKLASSVDLIKKVMKE